MLLYVGKVNLGNAGLSPFHRETRADRPKQLGSPFLVFWEGGCIMSEKPICQHCGYVGPVDARYCAHCGRALVPPNVRLTKSASRILSSLSPFHIGFLALVLSVPISAFAERLIVTGLSFPLSLVPLALIIGCGYAYLGWRWNASLSGRSHLLRMLLAFAGMGGFLVAVWLVDRALLSLLSDRTQMVVYQVPGVYRESSAGYRQISIDSNVLPYGLIAMVYGVLTAVAGNLIHRAGKRQSL
jgi:ribosomal protein L40E